MYMASMLSDDAADGIIHHFIILKCSGQVLPPAVWLPVNTIRRPDISNCTTYIEFVIILEFFFSPHLTIDAASWGSDNK
jgi:hypothetical protein